MTCQQTLIGLVKTCVQLQLTRLRSCLDHKRGHTAQGRQRIRNAGGTGFAFVGSLITEIMDGDFANPTGAVARK